ncbi:MAG: N-acetylmannosamine-6-phosphate 2-epimerase [Bifidobacterium longum]|uniref:N-acetylmannosamine-6-phosphate 2-epimerase n=1 Tax=Bifidobacterium longum TaxID=216816 RepID=UPI00351CE878|nr:N-acetylmannosamine-6-phosphate 2-epimerase [Bifidobacterium longum]
MNTNDTYSKRLIDSLHGKLIVSCQAYPGEPMRHPETMAQVAQSVEIGGAAAIRCQGLADISAIKGQVKVPVIGIWKEGDNGVYITPTLHHARACIMAGADIVALDATDRPRPDGLTLQQTARQLKSEGAILMADCGCIEDSDAAVDAGFDIISTTLAGYTDSRAKTEGPDYELLAQMLERHPHVPVICEGRIHTPSDAAKAIEMGAWAAVVGTAITHPMTITSWFADAVRS